MQCAQVTQKPPSPNPGPQARGKSVSHETSPGAKKFTESGVRWSGKAFREDGSEDGRAEPRFPRLLPQFQPHALFISFSETLLILSDLLHCSDLTVLETVLALYGRECLSPFKV